MRFLIRRSLRVVPALILSALFAAPGSLLAQTHVVNPSELQQQMVDTSAARQQNRQAVEQFFSSEAAQNALKANRIDPVQVKTAVASLSDAELATLAAQTQKAQKDFAAGDLNDRDLLIILVGIAALILIIVAVR